VGYQSFVVLALSGLSEEKNRRIIHAPDSLVSAVVTLPCGTLPESSRAQMEPRSVSWPELWSDLQGVTWIQSLQPTRSDHPFNPVIPIIHGQINKYIYLQQH
jgi:hypothetical protein